MEKGISQKAPGRALTWIVAITLGVPAVTTGILSVFVPGDGSWLLTGILTALLVAGLVFARTTDNRRANALLAVCAISALLFWPEVALRTMGLSANNAGTVVFGLVEPTGTIPAVHDPDLFWTLSPEQPGINSDGFRNSEFVVPKPKGYYRIIFLGDSCTQQGFPKYVERILNQEHPDGPRYEAINLGISGYSSHQGLVVARRWLARLEPDLVVVYFGWNDHWQSVIATDSERSSWYRRMLVRLLSSSRLFQVGVWAIGPRAIERAGPPRVSLAEYRENLASIGNTAQSVNANGMDASHPIRHLGAKLVVAYYH